MGHLSSATGWWWSIEVTVPLLEKGEVARPLLPFLRFMPLKDFSFTAGLMHQVRVRFNMFRLNEYEGVSAGK